MVGGAGGVGGVGWVFHNFLRLFNGWENFPFTTSEIKCDYY